MKRYFLLEVQSVHLDTRRHHLILVEAAGEVLLERRSGERVQAQLHFLRRRSQERGPVCWCGEDERSRTKYLREGAGSAGGGAVKLSLRRKVRRGGEKTAAEESGCAGSRKRGMRSAEVPGRRRCFSGELERVPDGAEKVKLGWREMRAVPVERSDEVHPPGDPGAVGEPEMRSSGGDRMREAGMRSEKLPESWWRG